MFNFNDIQAAVKAGIFDSENNVTANPAAITLFFEDLAKEKAKKIQHEAAEIALRVGHDLTADQAHQLIMNIKP